MNAYSEAFVDGEYIGENCQSVVLFLTQEEMGTLTTLLEDAGIVCNTVDKY